MRFHKINMLPVYDNTYRQQVGKVEEDQDANTTSMHCHGPELSFH